MNKLKFGELQFEIIQGGMGLGVSTPLLAKTVSKLGGLGTVSGVAAGVIMARTLQNGDPGGHVHRALEHFQFQDNAESVIDTWFIPSGIPKKKRYPKVDKFTLEAEEPLEESPKEFSEEPSKELIDLMVCGNFANVWLAKEGHDNPISVNFLEKVATPHPFSIWGAMLARVDVITMGAGIPKHVPAMLNAIAEGRPPTYPIPISGGNRRFVLTGFNAEEHFGRLPEMERPAFLPIISSHILARRLLNNWPKDAICGFVVEKPTAGGHNAPPRRPVKLDKRGQPKYEDKDEVDLDEMKALKMPFWMAGSYGSPERVAEAKEDGANGVQVGTPFALCNESGIEDSYKKELRRQGYLGELDIFTDPVASPTGFPFKVARLSGTLSDNDLYEARRRVCNIGGLVTYVDLDGKTQSRCPAEPVKQYVSKGGNIEDTRGRVCLCNALLATVGLGDPNELAIITLGDDVSSLKELMKDENDSYSAEDVLMYLLGEHA